jgi:hypothetical protein
MNAGISGEDAVKTYQASIQQALQANNRPAPPRILGSGGGVPVEQVDTSNPSARKKIVAQMLANANKET